MSGFTCSIEVEAPCAHTFEVFTDLRGADARIEGIKRLEVFGDDPIGVGTRFRETRVLYGREATEEITITAFDPPRGYIAEAHSHGTAFRSEFRFEDAGDKTRVELSFEARPVSMLARFLSFLSQIMMKGVRECTQQDLVDLKQAAEARAPR